MNEIEFTRVDPRLGSFALRRVEAATDASLLHSWFVHEKSAFWLMQNSSVGDVEHEYASIAASGHHAAFLGLYEGRPAFLSERYDPAHSELAGKYPARDGDVGMHFLTAPTIEPVHGFTLAVLVTVMEMLFADPETQRVVVEPDALNTAVHRLNAAVGFRVEETIELKDKNAYLSTCTRAQYLAASAYPTTLEHSE